MLKRGQQQQLVNLVGKSKSFISEIMCRKKQANVKLAIELELASTRVLGEENTIPWTEFVRCKTTTNKYFKGEPIL